MALIGRFYFKKTDNGNLIGEYSHNFSLSNDSECSNNLNKDILSNNSFIGKYETCWKEKKPCSCIIEISFKNLNNQTSNSIYTVLWKDNNRTIFWGEGFLVDGMLIGDYRDSDTNNFINNTINKTIN